jgi:4-amino-4-deoxy-L-arabinose transferase-like glycosyltransferase
MRFATRQATERTGQSLLRFRITAGAIVVICVALRLAHIASIHDSLFFENPVIDELFNDTAAQYLQTTSWLGPPRPLWKPPLYPYTLATTHALSGSRYLAPRILQAFLEGASCLLVMLIGVRLFSRTIALAGGALTALAGSLVFFTGTLVSASLAVFLGLLATAALLLVTKSESKWMFLSAGIAVGLASLNRPEMLLLTIPLAAIALNRAQIPLKQRCLWGALGVFGVALAVGPVTARNILRGGAPVLISDNGGINLYIGTAEKFGGMIGLRPGPEWDHLTREVENEYGLVPDKIKSPYYVRRSVEIITSDPLRYIRHVAYKALLFWHGYELMSNFDLYDARAQSPILDALLHDGPGLLIPFGLIGPLGLAGILLVFARRHRARVAALVPIVLCLTAMIFFVTARFRLPAIPLLALFAAFFVHDLIGYWRKRSYLTAATLSTCVLLVGVYANIDLFAENRASYARALKAERLRLESLVLADRFEDYHSAQAKIRQAMLLTPDRPNQYAILAMLLTYTGDYSEAVAQHRSAIRAVGDESTRLQIAQHSLKEIVRIVGDEKTPATSRFEEGVLCYAKGDLDCAISVFTGTGDDVLAGVSLMVRAKRHMGQGDTASALQDVNKAIAHRPNHAESHLLKGFILHVMERRQPAATAFGSFRELEWPRGSWIRKIVNKSVTKRSAEYAVLRAYSEYFPRDQLIQDALDALSSPDNIHHSDRRL